MIRSTQRIPTGARGVSKTTPLIEPNNDKVAVLLRASDASKRRATRNAALVAAGGVALFAVGLAAFRATSFLFLWGGLALALYVYYKGQERHGLVIWLRRFRPEYGTRIRFHRVLGSACLGLLVPVTVQDSSFSASFLAAWMRRGLPLVLSAMVFFVAGLLAVTLVALVLGLGATGIAVMAVLWLPAFAWLLYWFLMRAGFSTLEGDAGKAKAEQLLEAWKQKKGTVGSGVGVVKCDDDIWRSVVERALTLASVAIVDLTDPTDNRWWELSTALTILGSEKVILTVQDGTDLERLSIATEEQLARDAGLRVPAEWLRQNLVTYPAAQAPIGPARVKQAQALLETLRLELAKRVAADEAATSPVA